MKTYKALANQESHRLINHGPTVWVSTYDRSDMLNIAPIAWCSPLSKTPSRLLLIIGNRHKTYANIIDTFEFNVCIPHKDQVDLVRKTGAISGFNVNKFQHFDISGFKGKHTKAHIPNDCIGYLECRLTQRINQGHVDIIIGNVLEAFVDEQIFDERLDVTSIAGKSLHHLGETFFAVPGDSILEAE